MLDRLRQFANRPLNDGDRMRAFAIAVAIIAAVAAILALIDHPGPSREAKRRINAWRATPAPSAATALVPVSTPQAPSEESDVQPAVGDVRRSKQAARRFLAGYLPFTYGHGNAAAIAAATPELRAELARQRPRVPVAERRRHPRLELLQTNGVSRERATLAALVHDGHRRYTVRLELASTARGWLVTGLEA
jgi:hypothetical protein